MGPIFHRLFACLKWRQAKWGIFVLTLFFGTFVAVQPTYAVGIAQGTVDIVSRIMLLIAMMALNLAMVLGRIVVALLDLIIIPIMQYNGFSTSPVVSAGWAIVRDTVNLFFVIVLIVIAFGTIFGWKRISWQQQVPRLMIFALVINFSKTLCGLMIDIGQVVMLTFANALRDIAGGNFITLFGLNDIMTLSLNSPVFTEITDPKSQGPAAFDWMASGVAALFMMTIVLSTVIILTVILVWRIVMLWVLITISPLAWFMGGAKDVFDSEAYKEWWSNFKCYVAVGPILTFFLWLTLAVAGSGNIAAAGGFYSTVDTSSFANASGSLLKIFETSRLLSFIIGIAMLYAGFDAASKVCQAAQGGFVTSRLREGAAPKAIAAAIGLTAAAGARRVGRAAGREVGGKVERVPYLRGLTQAGRADMYRSIAQKTSSPTIARVAGGWAEQLEKTRAEKVKTAGPALLGVPAAELGTEAKLEYLKSLARSGRPPVTENGRQEAMVAFASILGDAKARGKLGDDNVKKLWASIGHDMEGAVKGDPTLHHNVEEFEKARPDIAMHAKGGKTREERIIGKIAEMDDVKKLDKAALTDETVQARLKQISSGYADEKGNELTAYDWIAKGRLGAEKQESLGPPKTIAEITTYDATAKIPPALTASDSRQITDVVSKDASELGSIDPEQLRANAGNNEVTRAAVEGLTPVGLQKLFRKYAEGDTATRKELDKAIDNAAFVAEQGSVSAANVRPYENMKKYIDSTRERMKGIPPRRSVAEIEVEQNPLVAKQAADQDTLRRLNSALETARRNNLNSAATIEGQVAELNKTIASQGEQLAKLDSERSTAEARERDEKFKTATQAKIT